MKRKISLAYSPCPNDTYIFGGIALGLVSDQLHYDITLGDVGLLNSLGTQSSFDVIKMSYHAWAYLTDEYQMLPFGSALGFGVGPLLIADQQEMVDVGKIHRVAIPGKFTTANMLLDFAYGSNLFEKEVMIFSEIEAAISNGEVDAGVIIHENRFTYQERGYHCIQDLGQYWETETKLPIPLGGIAVKRSLPDGTKQAICRDLQESIALADRDFDLIRDYVKRYAQDMDVEIMKKHIDLYVNQSTRGLSKEDIRSIEYLLTHISKTNQHVNLHADWLANY